MQYANVAKVFANSFPIIIDSLTKCHGKNSSQKWFFSINHKLKFSGKDQKPRNFQTTDDWAKMSDLQRMVIWNLIGNYTKVPKSINKSQLSKLQMGYRKWTAGLTANYAPAVKSTCNIFVGEVMFITQNGLGPQLSGENHYYQPAGIFKGRCSKVFRHVKNLKNVKAGHAHVTSTHIEIITKMNEPGNPKKGYEIVGTGWGRSGGQGTPKATKPYKIQQKLKGDNPTLKFFEMV